MLVDAPIAIEIVKGIREGIKVETKPAETQIPKGILQDYANQVSIGRAEGKCAQK